MCRKHFPFGLFLFYTVYVWPVTTPTVNLFNNLNDLLSGYFIILSGCRRTGHRGSWPRSVCLFIVDTFQRDVIELFAWPYGLNR